MKILHIIQTYHPAIGGSETWCRNVCLFSAKRGIVTNVATMNTVNMAEAFDKDFSQKQFILHQLSEQDYDDGVVIKRYALWKPWSGTLIAKIINFLFYKLKLCKTQIGEIFIGSPHSFEMYGALFKEIKNTDIVVLHTLPYFHNLVGYAIAKLYGKAVINVPYFHPEHVQHEKKLFFNMMNHCDAIIALSDYEKKYLINKGVQPQKIFVHGSSIDTEALGSKIELENFKRLLSQEYGFDEKSKCLLFIGRKNPYKGIGTLIKAAEEIANEENITLFLFLAGPDTRDFLDMYQDCKNSIRLKTINFGQVSDEEKDYLLELCDVLVLPSKFEAFGIVFLEAWKHKKPVIGTNRGGIPAIIGEAGLCFEYGNVTDLKEKIKLILNNDALAKKFGEAGKKRLEENYTIQKVGESFVNICRKLKKQTRILIVSQLLPPYYIGGAEIVAYEQSKKLKDLGFEMKVFAGRINDSQRQYGIKREKGAVDILRFNLHHKDFFHLKFANFNKEALQEKFMSELYNYAPDLVHFHNIFALSLEMIGNCHEMRIPTVMTLHDYWGICPNNLLLDNNASLCAKMDCSGCLYNLTLEDGRFISTNERNLKCIEYYNKINLLISPSQYLAKRYIERGIFQEKLEVIGYGIDCSRFENIKKIRNKRIRFGFIGQIIWHKGIENLLYAMELLNKQERENISLTVIGTGEEPFLSYCKTLAKKLDFIKFLGKANNDKINLVLNQIDVLIVPSIWPENSPVTILEAFASGTPVIASNIGGIPELVEDGINGYLYKHDEPISLAENIRKIIKNPQIIDKMRQACLIKAKEHDLINNITRISEHYRRLIYN